MAALALGFMIAPAGVVRADEDDAKRILRAMSDYLAAQDRIAFDYDATLDVVTDDEQKLGLASSGTVMLERPDRLRSTRSSGFVDTEAVFDGETLTLLGKNANGYVQVEVPGTVDQLVDTLRDRHGVPLPAADLLMSNPYDELMSMVEDVKDLGSGVIGGVECDWLAFRTPEVDWQIWVAQGERPYPCRYVITTKQVAHSPQYTIQLRDWRTGDQVPADDFAFTPPSGASEIATKDLRKMVGDLPLHFARKE